MYPGRNDGDQGEFQGQEPSEAVSGAPAEMPSFPPAAPPVAPPVAAPATVALPENVLRGMSFGFLGVVGGIVLTVVVWRLGFVAGITSLVLSAGATFLYAKGAGAPPKRGVVPLVVMIVLGVVVAFFGVIASDAWVVYDDAHGLVGSQNRISFIVDNMFRGEVIRSYGKDMVWFALFGALGVYGTLRRLIAQR
jgi:hypothetical protein